MAIISAGAQEYEIMGPDGYFPVKLREYNCGCGSWQISGIPCSHAIAAISHNCITEALRDKVPMYVHQCLTKNAYMQTYRGMIQTIRYGLKLKLVRCFHHHLRSNLADPKCKERENPVRRPKEAGHGLLCAHTVRCPDITKEHVRKQKSKQRYNFSCNVLFFIFKICDVIQFISLQQRSPSITEALSSHAVDANPTRKKKIKVIYKFIVIRNYGLAII
ncbi:hypothetical protein Ddye_002115 [Dipteronia dyeriana]|uniref:SWIM-type domain-containing protein n=1 Tax=Dipteronia dyeriana TaxID=168575 RepID=A0AAD9XPQ3_9ROSI|nr:hypothetical protein Ddye_002115 [Dipteronia dyeriana]